MTKSSNTSPNHAHSAWSTASLTLALCAIVCAASLVACEDKTPAVATPAPVVKATTPTAIDLEWKALQTKLADPEVKQGERLGLLQAFQRKHRKTAYAQQARELSGAMRAQRKMTRVSRRASSYVERGVRRAWGQSFAQQSSKASPEMLRDVLLFEVVRNAYRFSKRPQAFEAVTLVGASGATRRVERPVLLGLGVARLNMMSAITTTLPSFKVDGCVGFGERECYQQTVNGLSKVLVGQPLYKGNAQMNPKAVGPMLELLALTNKAARVLGVSTKAFYEAYRPTLLALAHTHNVLAQKKHAAVVLKKHKALLKTHAALEKKGAYHREMLRFYKDTVDELGLAAHIGESSRVLRGYTGFWIRRMADGTSDEFAKALKDIITAHDQPNTIKLYK